MKVLQINVVYGKGSTGRITAALHEGLLRDGIESLVVYGRGERVSEPGVTLVGGEACGKINGTILRLSGSAYGACSVSTKKIIDLIKREHPDAVHLQCINGHFVNIYRLVEWLGANRVPTVLTLHAEFMYTANCSHAFECDGWKQGCIVCPRPKQATGSILFRRTARNFKRMQKSFNAFEGGLIACSVSPWLMSRASVSPVLHRAEHRVVLNGVDTAVFKPRSVIVLRYQHALASKPVLFHATAKFSDNLDDPKGGWFVLELARRLADIGVEVLVAGRSVVRGPLPQNVTMLGEIKDQALLASYYSLADLTVLTSRRETFSMVCAESLCCGTPVVGFCAGGPEQISLAVYSEFVSYGDMDALEQAVRAWLPVKRAGGISHLASEAASVYSLNRMVSEYEDVYGSVAC